MFLKSFFGKVASAVGGPRVTAEPWDSGYRGIPSRPDGRFRVFVHAQAWKLLSSEAGLTLEDLLVLPERVHATCERLGLLRQAPGQFFLESTDRVHPTDAPMSLTRISPPLDASPELGPGHIIDRAIVIYPKSFREELAMRGEKARRLYTRIGLAHELAHVFATDEFHGPFNGMGFARLERLTDSIAFHLFEQELLDAPAAERADFVKCFSYIAAFVRAALNPTADGGDLVLLSRATAAAMIEEGRKFRGPARPSETGMVLGAPSMEHEHV